MAEVDANTQVLPIAFMQPIKCSKLFELVSINICGSYPISYRGNCYILVITDHFIEFVDTYAILNQEAVTVAFCFETLINTFVYRDIIFTDLGRNFKTPS